MISGQTLAETTCEARGLEFADLFRNQFLFTRNRDLNPTGLTPHRLFDCTLFAGRDVRVVHCETAGGAIGLLCVGLAVSEAGALVDADFLSDITGPEDGQWRDLEQRVERLGGKYAVFARSAGQGRVYVDPGATMSVVYDRRTETIASTTALCIDRELIDHPPFSGEAIMGGKVPMVLGRTPDVDVRYLKANHYLDLGAFSEIRHWPRDGSLQTSSAEDSAEIVQKRLSTIVTAMRTAGPIALPLSGGRDSRILSAFLKPVLKDIDYIYSHTHNFMTRLDTILAGAVSKRLGVDCAVIRMGFDGVPPEDRRARRAKAWEARIASGFTSHGIVEHMTGMTAPLPKGAIVLRGGLIDLVRAVWWRGRPTRRAIAGVGDDVEMLNLYQGHPSLGEGDPERFDEYRNWRDSLPQEGKDRVHDFMFLEQFYPASWQKFYQLNDCMYCCPASDRQVISAILSQPLQERFHLKTFDKMMAHLAPELDDIPTHYEFRRRIKRLPDDLVEEKAEG